MLFKTFAAFFIGIWLLTGHFVHAQDNRDFESWTSAEFRYRPSKKWRLGLEAQLRLKENSSVIDGYFSEFTGGYEFFKGFRTFLGFRFIRRNDNTGRQQGWENFARLHLDAAYKHDISRFGMNYRLRYQTRDELGVTDENGDFADQTLRLKIGTEYNIRKWKLDPQLSAEIFHTSERNAEEGFDKFRITFGTEYKFEKWGRLGIFYRYEREINRADPASTDILRIKYVYTLKGY